MSVSAFLAVIPSRQRVRIKLLSLFLFCFLFRFASAGEPARVTVLLTSDIHAHVGIQDPARDWRRLATVIRAERRRAGGRAHCLLIDCGDTIQGTLAGALSVGALAPPALAALKYDAWIPGNHELDFGVSRLLVLIQQVEKSGIPVLNGNLSLQSGKPLPAWHLFRRAGMKLAVIGMNASALHHWLLDDAVGKFQVEPAITAIQRVLPAVLAVKPDIVILAIHQGWMEPENDPRGVNEVARIAAGIPEIQLILGAHTHRVIPGIRVGSSWYVQAGKHAQGTVATDLVYDREERRILSIQSRFVAAENAVRDPELERVLKPFLDQTEKKAKAIITTLPKDISAFGTPGVNCAISEVFCRAIAAATGADIVMHGRLSRASLPGKKPLTEADLFAAVPYENSLITARLTRSQLRQLLNEQLKYLQSSRFTGIWGASVKITGPPFQVLRITPKNSPDKQDRYLVAFNSYTVAGAGGRFPLLAKMLQDPAGQTRDTKINSRDAIRSWLRTAGKAAVSPPHHWLILPEKAIPKRWRSHYKKH